MNGITKKKLNLLVHLARIDGNFHRSEKEMLSKLVGEERSFNESTGNPLENAGDLSDKEEILYLALKLIQADEVITEEELGFCRKLAGKLGFRENVVDRYAHFPLPSLEHFTIELKQWKAPGK